MVSLINFKTYNEELQRAANGAPNTTTTTSIECDPNSQANYTTSRNESGYERTPTCCNKQDARQTQITHLPNAHLAPMRSHHQHHQLKHQINQQEPNHRNNQDQLAARMRFNSSSKQNDDDDDEEDENDNQDNQLRYRCPSPDQFTVTWRNLKFSIEPKWHTKLANDSPISRLADRLKPARSTGSQQVVASSNSSSLARIVLDKLDGSFRSGELTAILGPSGEYDLFELCTVHSKQANLVLCFSRRAEWLRRLVDFDCRAAAALYVNKADDYDDDDGGGGDEQKCLPINRRLNCKYCRPFYGNNDSAGQLLPPNQTRKLFVDPPKVSRKC